MADVKLLSQSGRPGETHELGSLATLGGVLWTQTESTTLMNWTAAASMLKDRPLVPPSLMKKGNILRIKLRGVYKTLNSARYTVSVTFDNVVIAQLSNIHPTKGGVTTTDDKGWGAEILVCFVEDNKVSCQIDLYFSVNGTSVSMTLHSNADGAMTKTIDNLTSLPLDVKYASASASSSNVMTVLCGSMEVLKP